MQNNHPESHNPKKLLVEMDARIRVRDIREWEKLKRQVEVKWWESGLIALLFISGVGTIVTLAKILPDDNRLIYEFVLAWCVIFVLALIACIEFLILKFRALRRMHEVTTRQIDNWEETLKAIRAYLEAREESDHE